MPFSGTTFTKLYNWLTDPQRNEKIFNSRLDDEFGGVATGLTTLAVQGTLLATYGPTGRVYLSADQGGNAINAYSKINFDTVDFDPASMWNAANKRFIPTVSGTYWAVCTCEVVPSLAYAVTQAGASGISKNGTRLQGQTLALWSTGGSGETFAQTGCLVQVNGSTDYIEGLGGALAASGTCTFKGALSSGTTLSINRVGP